MDVEQFHQCSWCIKSKVPNGEGYYNKLSGGVFCSVECEISYKHYFIISTQKRYQELYSKERLTIDEEREKIMLSRLCKTIGFYDALERSLKH